ncbi:MAG: CPBP family glutamic-type intramembrane protease [Rickettsiales bacterium]|nr:CPBP family glutamic-type intramembrane protease [Rickettsiales bacterium]
MKSKRWRAIECFLLFAVVPVAFMFAPFEVKRSLFGFLWVMAFACYFVWKRQTGLRFKDVWQWRAIPNADWIAMLRRFALSVALMIGFVYVSEPERLFEFMLNRPEVWIVVMFLYPLFSVIPQEVVYRLFFFERYADLLPHRWAMIVASGVSFGHAHVIFNNEIAYILSIIGGIMFSQTYIKQRSFALVWAEHALYGCAVFTVGLGWYFYSGAQIH